MRRAARSGTRQPGNIRLKIPAEPCKAFRATGLGQGTNMRAEALERIRSYTKQKGATSFTAMDGAERESLFAEACANVNWNMAGCKVQRR